MHRQCRYFRLAPCGFLRTDVSIYAEFPAVLNQLVRHNIAVLVRRKFDAMWRHG